jgi:hypothetical protein
MHPKDVFTDIYNKNLWGSVESISGSGSEIRQTKSVILSINQLIKDYKIASILDIPCGDFNWMKHVDLENVKYTGADIVEDLILLNNKKYSKGGVITFRNINLIDDLLPMSDLIIVRDCFIHFSFKDIQKSIQNIKNSGSKYLLTTSFVDCNENSDIITGSYRKINLLKLPFSFPEPLLIITENCTEDNGLNLDKSLLLWKIENINNI